MKKCLLLLFTISFFSFSQNSRGILSSDANIRRSPSLAAEKIKILPKGKEVLIIQTKGNWSFIEDPTNNKKGWVSNSLIRINKTIIIKNANVRRSPSLAGEKLKIISKGTEVVVLLTKNSWSFIKDLSNNKKGWVSSSLISASNVPKNNQNVVSDIIKLNIKTVPNCDYIITTPSNGGKSIDINPTTIRWKHATGKPKGYYLSIGSNNEANNILDNINTGNKNYYLVKNLKPNTTYYLGLIPYNEVGLAKDCDGIFSFTTGSGIAPNNKVSSEQIIERRLTKMGVKWKWDTFKRNKKSKIKVNDINDFISEVNSYMGVPYKMSGTTRAGIDCSGLIWKGLRATGYNGERLNAQSLAQSGRLIADKTSLQVGDLVCFTNTRGINELVHHIGIYVGNKKFIHASSSKGVIYSDINDPYYWGNKFIFGIRY